MTEVEVPFGGPTSAVTAKWPPSNIFSKLLPPFIPFFLLPYESFFSACASGSAICSNTIRRGPPYNPVDQSLGGLISDVFSRVPSFFILSKIRYHAQSTSWLISHLPLFVPPHGPFMMDFAQRTIGQIPPVRWSIQFPHPAQSSVNIPAF